MRREKRRCLVFSLVAVLFVSLFMSMNFTVYADGGCNISIFQSINGTINPDFSENIVCNDTMYRAELLSISENYTLDDLTAIADGSDISEQVKNSLVTNGYVLIDVSSYSSLSITYYWTGSGNCVIGSGSDIGVSNPHIKVFDEYLIDADTTDKVTRVDAEANDYSSGIVWSYNPSSDRMGYQYNGNLSVIAFDWDGNSVDVNANFESIDASTGAVSFIPEDFKEIYITYQYSDGSVPPRPIAGYYNLTVRDHFGLQTSIREKKVVPDGTPYNYDALSREGWIVVGSINYNGVVTGDTVLDFYYEREADPQPDPEPQPTPDPEPTPEPQPVVQQYTITVYDHFGTSVELREQKTVDNGTVYSYSALERDDWKCTGYTNCDGVVNNADVIIDFYYGEVIIPPAPEPQPISDPDPSPEPDPTPVPIREPEPTPEPQPTPDPTPTPSSEPEPNEPVLDDEPKTGDTTSSIPFILSVLGLVGAVAYKKRNVV